MSNVPFQPILQEDLQDPALTTLNDTIRRLTNEVNRLSGYAGPVGVVNGVSVGGNLNMNGFKIINQGT
jgi:hypothetical protein